MPCHATSVDWCCIGIVAIATSYLLLSNMEIHWMNKCTTIYVSNSFASLSFPQLIPRYLFLSLVHSLIRLLVLNLYSSCWVCIVLTCDTKRWSSQNEKDATKKWWYSTRYGMSWWHCCNNWGKRKKWNEEKIMNRQINIPNRLTRFQLYSQICIFYTRWRKKNEYTIVRTSKQERKCDCL